jgi:hypothetical protein
VCLWAQGPEVALRGEWRLDLERTIADQDLREGDDRIRVLSRSLKLRFDANGDATAEFEGKPPQTGRWKTEEESSPNRITIRIFEKGREEKGGDAIVEFLDKDTIRFTAFAEGPLVFTRIKKTQD